MVFELGDYVEQRDLYLRSESEINSGFGIEENDDEDFDDDIEDEDDEEIDEEDDEY